MRTRHQCLVALLLSSICGGDAEEPVRRFRIELIYTLHTAVDTDAKLDRIRAVVLKAHPNAKFEETSAEDRWAYYGVYRDRLLRMAGASLPAADDPARDEWFRTKGYEIAKAQVNREVALRSIYQFLLHTQAKDDVSLKTIFDRLKVNDDANSPVCGTEPGKTIVYRDFGGRGLTGEDLDAIEDGGVRFSASFRLRVAAALDGAPRLCPKAFGLGEEGEGRQIFRLVAATTDPAGTGAPSGR
jgi:hypothetical protein